MAEEEALRWAVGPNIAGIGIAVFFFGHDDLRVFGGASAEVLDVDVGELDVLNGVAGDAAEDGGDVRGGVVADEVVDEDALRAFRPSWFPWGRAGERRGG